MSIGALTDVNTTGVTSGDILVYNGGTGEWEPGTGGGGAVDSVNGQTGTVVLDGTDIAYDAGSTINQAIAGNTSNYNLLRQYIVDTDPDKVVVAKDSSNKIEIDSTVGGESIVLTTDGTNAVTVSDGRVDILPVVNATGGLTVNNNVGIGTTTPAYPLDVDGGTENTVASFSSTDSVAQIRIADGDATPFYLGVVGNNAYISPTGGTPADGLTINSTGDVTYGDITTTQNGSIVRGGFVNPASEANMVHLPHIVNDLAGFQNWGTITTSGLYWTRSGTSGSYTYSNEVTASDFDNGASFDGYSSTAGSWYSDDGVDGNTAGAGTITLEWSNELTYSAWAGIVFGANNFTATRVKIEAYRGGAWQTLCDITDNTDQVVLRQIGSNSGPGSATNKLRYTLGGSVNNGYFRIHTLYAANYRAGDNNLSGTFTDKTRGVHYLEKYKNNYVYGHFYPADTNTYNLGASSLQWNTIYSNGGNSSQWNTAYGWGDHASAGYLTTSTGDSRYIRNDTSDYFSGKLTFNGTAGSDALDLGSSDINAVRQIHANEYHQNGSGVPRSNLGDPTVTEMALFEEQFTCKTGLNNDYDDLTDLTFWTQATSGSSWVEESVTDDKKRRFLRTNDGHIDFAYGTYKFRVEFRGKGYTFANAIYSYFSTQGHDMQVHVWKKRCSDGTWIQHTAETDTVESWPGHLWMPFNRIPWYETNTTSESHFSDIRIEFTPNWNSTYPSNAIRLSGLQVWGGYPTGRRTPHRYDQNGKLITWGDLEVSGNLDVTGDVAITGDFVNDLSFATGKSLLVGTDEYAFKYISGSHGLKFDTTNAQYAFTDGSGSSLVTFQANNGDTDINRDLQVGRNLNVIGYITVPEFVEGETNKNDRITFSEFGLTAGRIHDIGGVAVGPSSATATYKLGFCEEIAANLILRGLVSVGITISGTPALGQPLYLGASGTITVTAPSTSGDIVRVIGHYMGEEQGGGSLVYFDPSNDWVEVS
jgi:hypothetical protein